jgi:hypothetical protein
MFASVLSMDSQRFHEDVLGGSTEENTACGARLSHLRSLVAAGNLKEAADLSLAFEPRHRADKMHADCHADQPHVGEGSIALRVATPNDRHAAAKPVIDSFITLHNNDDAAETTTNRVVLPLTHASGASVRRKSAARVPVVGFALDGKFILTESPLRCTKALSSPTEETKMSCSGGGDLRAHVVNDEAAALSLLSSMAPAAGKRRRSEKSKTESERRLMTEMGKPLIGDSSVIAAEMAARHNSGPTTEADLGDTDTTYAIGSKTTLVIPMVPSDGVTTDDQTGYANPAGYDFGLVKSAHGSNIRSYLEACMQANSDFFQQNSWGAMDLDYTITPVVQVAPCAPLCSIRH